MSASAKRRSDADPVADPLVVGVHALGEVVVGDDVVGLDAAQPEDPGARRGRGELRPGSWVFLDQDGRLLQIVRGLQRQGGRALELPLDQADERTRRREFDHGGDAEIAELAMQASHRTGRVTW